MLDLAPMWKGGQDIQPRVTGPDGGRLPGRVLPSELTLIIFSHSYEAVWA